MNHDYVLPRNWSELTPEQKDNWFHVERARRQALRQDTETSRMMYEGDATA
jgi:hypothetical protein